MGKCIVAGGGFAGLASSVFLSSKNIKVELLEASPKLGGRAYSFYDEKHKIFVDNGQHILMGCYEETLKFLKIIDAQDNLYYQDSLKVVFCDKYRNLHFLKSPKRLYPINLLYAILNYSAISFKDKISVINFFINLFLTDVEKINEETVSDWLSKNKQSISVQKALWEILAIGALNTSIDKASAKLFAAILKRMFFAGNYSSTIVIPAASLSEMYCNQSKSFIEDNGGAIHTSESLKEIVIVNNVVTELITNQRSIRDFSCVLLTMPPFALKKVKGLPEDLYSRFDRYSYSSILTFHIWIKNNPLNHKFYGLIDSKLHWVFNHYEYLTTVISDADSLINRTDDELFRVVSQELKTYLSISDDQIIDWRIIKEKRATFIPTRELENYRPHSKTTIENLFLAGDWINTGLPSTIEGAVKSAKDASKEVTSYLNNSPYGYT